MIAILILISNIWFGGDIKKLGSEDFHTRHALTEKLYGTTKGFWLSICTRNNDDPEIRFRGELIFRKRKFGHETLIVYQALTTIYSTEKVSCSKEDAYFWAASPYRLEILQKTAVQQGWHNEMNEVDWKNLRWAESVEKAVKRQITAWKIHVLDTTLHKCLPHEFYKKCSYPFLVLTNNIYNEEDK